MVLLATLAVLVSALVFVVWVLPGLLDDKLTTIAPTGEFESPPSTAPVAPSPGQLQQARDKREAERLLRELLTQQAALEAQQAGVWGGGDYEAALERLAEGDVAFADGRFADAAAIFTDVIERFRALEAARPQRLAQALARAAAALADYDSAGARRQFGIALAIEPGHPDATRGLARAETLQQLVSLLEQGAAHEARGDWAAALERYQAAARLDPDAQAAAEGAARSTAALEAARFRTAMSEALTAIDGGELEQARAALSRARGLQPDAAEIRDAELRLRAAQQAREIAGHREQARRLEAEERWAEAAEAYQAVLAIDDQAQFARMGRGQARQLAELHAQLDLYLESPERLRSAEPRANAERLLNDAGTLPQQGSRLQAKLTQLERLVRLAVTPVAVLIRSDGQTEVSIDRVAKLGRLTEQQIALLPGSYRVRGTRVGYRDLRLEVDVEPGVTGQVVDVRCDVKI